ncbi:LacI family transcriptional regulator [Nocardioides marinisabuli]|uniref:LacI family transcriptional regulator n=1 Tax=Nocardioides marinisabuli TaxID=419476 RepID=A0A7Y9JQN9_9ACTN|nr:LacI family DNA-binding transcriptional regulator [Nocardioides marinisabuli]NYD57610.1 LacI family transcriptional regulator [Nocardioides marinisabuli]
MAAHRSATMADVARLAGVSVATVSRTLSGTRAVDPAMQRKVTEAAAELNYQVNLVGRALRQTRTSTVGLIVPDLENPYFSALAQQLARAFSAPGIDLLVFSADGSLETEARGVRSFLGRQVDALVLIPVHEQLSEASVAIAAAAVHTIQLDRHVPGTASSYVGVSNRAGMRLVRDHITECVDLDAQPVVYVGAAPGSSSAHERLDGVRRWFSPEVPTLLGDFSAAWGREAAARLLADGWEGATIVTAADIIALGVVSHLLHQGRSIPGDFRVIGFDGVGAVALAHPSLTTVRQPVEEMAQSIRALIESDEEPSSRWFEPELVLGATSPASGSELSG